jgi:23S rRNA pseudouridine2605 synthase
MERLQKVLSMAGLGSRRAMEEWITQGLVMVNGQVATIGQSVSKHDKIKVSGKPINNPLSEYERTRILLYHKPIGEISSTKDPKHSKTVFDNLPKLRVGRWIQVGRLDINTQGLLVFTNNGDLANKLMHPSNMVEREYAARVYGRISPDIIKNLLQGVVLEDGIAKFTQVRFGGGEGINSWYHVVILEGRNREVRRMWQSQGIEVSRLVRIRYGGFVLPRSLPRGKSLELSGPEIREIKSKMGL